MAGFKIDIFKGIRPRITATKLPDGEAVRAENARLGSTNIQPLHGKTTVVTNQSAGDTSTIYLFDNGGSPVWFEWNSDVDLARGPVKDDSLERTYYTGDGAPKYTYTTIAVTGGGPYPEDYRNLGVPAPSTAPTISADDLPEDNDQDERFVTAVATTTFTIGNVDYTNYLSQSGVTGIWSFNSTNGTVLFDFPTGTLLRVTAVTDSNNVVVEAASGEGFVAQANSAAAYVKDMNEDGSGEDADWSEWRLPNGLKLTISTHNLRVGDVLRVTRLTNSSGIRFTPDPPTETFHEQSWDAPAEVFDGGASSYQVQNASIAADSGATTDFSLQDTFYYEVDRALSTVSESEERYYVYTFVSALGEEGPPSPVSSVLECLDGDTVAISGLETPPSSGYDLTDLRIYRTNSSEDGAEYLFVKEITAAGSTSDTVDNADLGEIIPSTTWDPPDSSMEGIITMPNGMMAGFAGKTVFFCEPYSPHAWPVEYDQAVEYDIVGLAAIGNTLIVLTNGYPYFAQGAHPRNMNLRPYKFNQPCSSKESIATTNDAAYYASEDGLVKLGINGGEIFTVPWCTKEEWAGFLPSTIKGEIHDGKYVGFYDSANSIPQGAETATVSGTIYPSATEAEIIAGGKTIIITLVNDSWVEEANDEFNNARQDIIDNLVSSSSGSAEWNAIRKQIPVTSVVRTSDTVVTITLPALAGYQLSGLIEVIRPTAPGIAIKVNRDTGISAGNIFAIDDVDSYTSSLVLGLGSTGSTETTEFVYLAEGDPSAYGDAGLIRAGTPLGVRSIAYSASLSLYVAVGRIAGNPNDGWIETNTPANVHDLTPSQNWTERTHANDGDTDEWLNVVYWDDIDSGFVAGGNGILEYSTDGTTWNDITLPSAIGEIKWITYAGASYFYAVSDDNSVLRSPDISGAGTYSGTYTDFTPSWSGSSTVPAAVCSGNGRVLVVGDDSGAFELQTIDYGNTSLDDRGTQAHGDTFAPAAVAFGAGMFAAISSDGKVMYVDGDDSEIDPDNWTAPSDAIASGTTFLGLAYDQGSDGNNGVGFIAYGYVTATSKGAIFTSRDAINWIDRGTPIDFDSTLDDLVRYVYARYPETTGLD